MTRSESGGRSQYPPIPPRGLFHLMISTILIMAMVSTPMGMMYGVSADEPPDLMITGKVFYEHDGVHPISGDLDEVFIFTIRYSDPDDDPPQPGYPRLLIDYTGDGGFDDRNDLNLTMDHMTVPPYNYNLGADFSRNHKFEETGTFSYAFFVKNQANETAFMGPFNGPVVSAGEDPQRPDRDWQTESALWLMLVLICSAVFFVVGAGYGQRNRGNRGNRGNRRDGRDEKQVGPGRRDPRE